MDDIDSLIRARAICEALGGISRRCLYDRVKRGHFPKPDRPAQRRGEADLWRASTAKRGIEQYINRDAAAVTPVELAREREQLQIADEVRAWTGHDLGYAQPSVLRRHAAPRR